MKYKVFIDPMPSNCYVCPIFNNACGEVECWCNLDPSIGEFRDNQANSMTDEEGHIKKVRPSNCPLFIMQDDPIDRLKKKSGIPFLLD